jgi:rhodanese-related sulfurtransferase
MKLARLCTRIFLSFLAVVVFEPAFADDPVPISAEEAFDAVQKHVFPGTDEPATVVLLDVRDPQEVLSSGAAAAVKEIRFLDGQGIVNPEWGKVHLVHNGKFIEYDIEGRHNRVMVDKIETLVTEPIAYNIKLWDQTETGFDLEVDALQDAADAFAQDVHDLILPLDPDAVIVYCRTGGRSSFAGQLILNGSYTFRDVTYSSDLFPSSGAYNVYEIDDPAGNNGRGGFSGFDYSNVFNGYAGFPGRLTDTQQVPSVSWKDSGLPVVRKAKAFLE